MINSKRLYSNYNVDYGSSAFENDTSRTGMFPSEEANENDLDTLGITEDELDVQCDELFMQAPIVFKPNKNSEIDVLLAKTIKELKITIPIAHIKESCYLIGSQRVNLMLKRE